MVAGYTYSHALDDVGANWDFGYGSGLPQNAYNPGAEYANSDFDVRHRFTLSMTYAIPGKKGYGQALEGWEVNSIITLQTPQFWGPMDEGTDAAGIGPLPVSPPANTPIRWSFYGNPNDFKPTATGIPFFGGTDAPSSPTSNASLQCQGSRHRWGPLPGPPNHWPTSAAIKKAIRSCFRRPSGSSATWAATPSPISASETLISLWLRIGTLRRAHARAIPGGVFQHLLIIRISPTLMADKTVSVSTTLPFSHLAAPVPRLMSRLPIPSSARAEAALFNSV